ncbi:MAG: outer membrane beta-barrel protein [Cloacibacterium sp.]|nr:outer membrane beta-barrel protein [Cloacibacterium sp.]
MRSFFSIVFLLSCATIFAQDNNFLSYDQQIKHQVGIGLNNFIKSAFTSDANSYNLEYRYYKNDKIAWRAGVSYEGNSGESGYTQGGLKIGIDRNFRRYRSWSVYYGFDIMYKYAHFKNINKDEHNLGAGIVLGIQYNISKHFSISTEPTLYFKRNITVDHATFSKDNTTKWNEYGLGKVGYVQMNFHF